jgi:dTDP-4-amino-4,6-dideoxygalactose transaminase
MKLIRPIVPDMGLVAAYLAESFASGQLSNFGPAVRRLAAILGPSGPPVLTSSGHTALMAAAAAVGARRWAVPAFTFESTRLAVASQGCEVVYVDADPATGCITPDTLAAAGGFDALLLVCPLSTLPDFRAIRAATGVPIVVDAAATFGSPMTTAGMRAWCVSFHATKTFPLGEGGAIFGLSERDRRAAESFIQFGFDADKRPSGQGLNAKMSDYTAAVGLALMDGGRIGAEIAARLRNVALYRTLLAEMIPASAGGTVYSTMPIFAPSPVAALRIRAALQARGIGWGQYYRPLAPMPGAVSCYDRNICLPVHGGLAPGDVDDICDVVLSAAL